MKRHESPLIIEQSYSLVPLDCFWLLNLIFIKVKLADILRSKKSTVRLRADTIIHFPTLFHPEILFPRSKSFFCYLLLNFEITCFYCRFIIIFYLQIFFLTFCTTSSHTHLHMRHIPDGII